MPTITKKSLNDKIAEETQYKKSVVSKVVNSLFANIIKELGKGNRVELRDFAVFELRLRKARKAQNPKTLDPVDVEEKFVVKFKAGRLMKRKVGTIPTPPKAEMPVVEVPTSQNPKTEELVEA